MIKKANSNTEFIPLVYIQTNIYGSLGFRPTHASLFYKSKFFLNHFRNSRLSLFREEGSSANADACSLNRHFLVVLREFLERKSNKSVYCQRRRFH